VDKQFWAEKNGRKSKNAFRNRSINRRIARFTVYLENPNMIVGNIKGNRVSLPNEQIIILAEQFNIASQFNSHTPQTTPLPGLEGLVDRATKGGNHIFFGEPHANGMALKQYETLANSPEAFHIASRNGVKHLALEFPNELQGTVDRYMSGELSREQFKHAIFDNPVGDTFNMQWVSGDALIQFKERFTQTIDNANNAGMRVHFADMTASKILSQPESIVALEQKIEEQYSEDHPLNTKRPKFSEYREQYIENLTPEERAHLEQDYEEHIAKGMETRFDDSEQYNYLRSRIPMNEGIMGVVGNNHLNNIHKGQGIDDLLESEETKTVTSVEVHDSQTRPFMAEVNRLAGTAPSDLPDYTIIIDQQAIYDRDNNLVNGPDQGSANQPSTPKPEQRQPAPIL
jgi:hypothetical protein